MDQVQALLPNSIQALIMKGDCRARRGSSAARRFLPTRCGHGGQLAAASSSLVPEVERARAGSWTTRISALGNAWKTFSPASNLHREATSTQIWRPELHDRERQAITNIYEAIHAFSTPS